MKKYIYVKKENNKLEMIADGLNKYDQNIFYCEIISLTEAKLNEIYNAKQTFLENGKLKIEPKINIEEKKKEIEKEIDQADNLTKIKQAIKKLINL